MFLTGGSGLVGSHVAEQLRLAGSEVVALQRPGSDAHHLAGLGCDIVRGDLTDPLESHVRTMRGCHALVHAAALVYSKGPDAEIDAVNVEGTRSILTAGARAGVRHAVHLSSVAVYGLRPGPVDEDTPLDGELRPGDRYARSKREAELVVDEVRCAGGISVTVLRPAAVFGERDRLLTPRLARLARLPVVPLLGAGRREIPVVYAGNVASAVVGCLARPDDAAFVLATDTAMSQRDLVLGLARAMGRRARAVSIPVAVVRAAARAAEGLGVGPPGAQGLSPVRAVRLWTGGNPYRTRRIFDALDWSPPFEQREALERTADWLTSSPEAAGTGPAA